MTRLPVIVLILAIIAFFIYNALFVVNEREQAIVLRFGQIVDVDLDVEAIALAMDVVVDLGHGPLGLAWPGPVRRGFGSPRC